MASKKKYILDTETRNLSFIQTAVDLKKLGIKDHMFFLRLYDPSLRNVDPFDPYLDEDTIFRIISECIINPWYFFREVSRIPDQGNPSGIQYALNRATLASTWCFLNGIDNYLVIPRQIGKTQSTVAELLWTFLFGTTSSEFMFINMNSEKSVENLQRLKDQRDLLPKYLQFKIAFDDDGKEDHGIDNMRTITNSSNNNRIVTKPRATSIDSAEKIGRGSTQPIQYYDEFEFINHVKTIMEASGPAFVTASENAKRNNSRYCRIFTSTPGDLDSQPGQDALQVIEQTARWSEKFYDKDINDVLDYVDANSNNGIMYIEYQYQQLGKDEVWFKKVCRVLNNNPLKIKREIFLMRMRGSALSPYDPDDLAAIEERKGKIIQEIFICKIFKLNVYTELMKDRIYFIGVDVANGYGEDNSAVTVWDPYTLKPVAEFKSPNIGVKDLIQFLYILVKKFLPKSILAIERNANGESVLDHLRDTDIFMNIYMDNSKDLVEGHLDDKLDAHGQVRREAERRKLYGIYTQGKSRERMFELLDGHIREHKDKFVCEYIIDDLMKLVRTKTGKIAAGPGFHDDSIMSFNMCLYLYYYGNNLYRYGFVRGSLPTDEDRNTGMIYEDIDPYLSDTDREFFKGVDFTESKELAYMDNMKQMIENNRQNMISDKAFTPMTKSKEEKKIPIMDPYTAKLRQEMERAQKESEAFNRRVNFTNGAENMNEESFEENSLDWFDDLID